jgi:hypothetical protein
MFSRLLGQTPPAAPARPAPAEFGVSGRAAPTGLLKCEVLLPPKAMPVEVKSVLSEPVIEVPPEAPKEATTAKPTSSP